MSQEFNNALNDCLERVSQGENLQKCLSEYPQYREELGPLVQVAVSTMKFAETMTPSQQSKNRNFQSFMQAVQTAQTEPHKKPRYSFSWLPLAKPIAISLVAVVVLAMGAGVTTAASSDAVPGESPLLGQNHKRERPASIESFGRQQGANSCRSGKRSR